MDQQLYFKMQVATDDLDIRREQTAQILGVDASEIQGVRYQLDVLRSQGILIDLNVKGTSMFTRAASWEELGIADDDIRHSRFTRGQKFLIPEEQIKRIKSIESRMRQMLEKHSYSITGFYPYKWVPFTAYQSFRQEWNSLVEELNAVRADIIANLSEYVDLLSDEFTRVADAAWESASRQGYRFVHIGGVIYETRYDFVDAIVSRALDKMPSSEDIGNNLHAEYATAMVYGEADVEVENLKYNQMLLQQKEMRHQERMMDLEELERREKIQGMVQAEAEHARNQLNEMASPFQEVFVTLRRQIAADAVAILESIKKNGFVRGKVAEKGRGLVELFDLLAVHNDQELRRKLQELKSAIGPDLKDRTEGDKRNAGEIASNLEEIIRLSHTAAQDLAAGPTRFSLVEI